MSQIQSTTDYSLFKFFPNNRPVNKKHVMKLALSTSFEQKQRFSPIVVDKNYFIVDGQHRFSACKMLEIPIYYVMDESAEKEDIIDRNVDQVRWHINDYVTFYAQHDDNFKWLLSTAKQFKKNMSFYFPVIELFCGYDKQKGNIANLVKRGQIKITPPQGMLIEQFLNLLLPILKESYIVRKEHTRYLFTEKYMWAFSHLYLNNKSLFDKVISRIPLTNFKFPYCRSANEALEYLNYITRQRIKAEVKDVEYD